MEQLITTAQAADILGCSRRTVHGMVIHGELPVAIEAPVGPHGAYLFHRHDVEQVRDQRAA